LESLDTELADALVETLKNMTEMLIYKKNKGLDVSLFSQHCKSVFYMLIRCLGVYNNFKLLGKGEPEQILAQKQKTLKIMFQMNELIP
jgi:hypothetical protein